MRILILAAVICLIAVPAGAEPTVLKCSSANGTTMADLTIDLDKGRFVWGQLPYIITQSSDEYISAFRESDVGGDIFAINRVTGEFKRASVGIFYSSDVDIGADGRPTSPGKFNAFTYTGRCGRKLF